MCAVCLLLILSLFGSADLFFFDLSELEGVELEEVDTYVGLCWIGFDGIDTWLSTYFYDLNV